MLHISRIEAIVAQIIDKHLIGREILNPGLFYCKMENRFRESVSVKTVGEMTYRTDREHTRTPRKPGYLFKIIGNLLNRQQAPDKLTLRKLVTIGDYIVITMIVDPCGAEGHE